MVRNESQLKGWLSKEKTSREALDKLGIKWYNKDKIREEHKLKKREVNKMKYEVANTYTEYEVEVNLRKDFEAVKKTWTEEQCNLYDDMLDECYLEHTITVDEIGKVFDIPVDLVIYEGWFYVED